MAYFDTFNEKMNNPESRNKFFNGVSQYFDIGSIDEFEKKISRTDEPLSSKEISQGVERIANDPKFYNEDELYKDFEGDI